MPVAGTALLMTLLAASVLYAVVHRAQVIAEVSTELLTVTGLKASQIRAWRNERLGDARMLQSLLEGNDWLGARREDRQGEPLRAHLEQMRRSYGYEEILIYGGDLALQFVQGPGAGPTRLSEETVRRSAEEVRPFDCDLYRTERGGIFYDLVVPIRQSGVLTGLAVLRCNVRTTLFPLVSYWPLPQASAESFLLKPAGDRWLTLTDLRGRTEAALTFSLPRDHPNLAATRALAETPLTSVEGLDYRGEKVIASVRPIDGTDWLLVAKIDRSEVIEHLRAEMIGVAVAGVLSLLSTGLLLYGYVKRRTWQLEEQRLAAEEQKAAAEARLGLLMSHANDVVLLLTEEGKIVEANDRACAVYGRPKTGMIGLDVRELRAPSARATLAADFAAAREGGTVFETRHVRADGGEFPVEVSARAVALEGQRYVLSVVREISQRKAHEAEIRRLSDLYQLLSHINQAIVRQQSRPALFQEVCDVLVRSGLFRLAWIGWHSPATRTIAPIAIAGDARDYVQGIVVSSDATLPEGRGPTGRAVREGTIQVANDLADERGFGAWREEAEKHGLRSSVSVPLVSDGSAVGALSVYSGEANAFGPGELAVLQDAVRDIVFALDTLRTREARARAERALLESEKRLQHLLENTPAVIFSLDPRNFSTLYLSNNLQGLLGYSAEEFMANPRMWHECLHPDDAVVSWHAADEFHGRDRCTRQYRMRHRAGHYVWLHEETRVLRGVDGEPRELVGNWTDITLRMQDEEQLRKLSRAIEQNPASIVITDLSGTIEYVNPRFVELTGYTLEEVRGKNPRLLKSGLTDDAVFRSLWGTITAGEVWRGEIVNRKKSGEIFTELVVVTPVVDGQGRSTHYVAVKEDITQRKAVEERLRQLSRTIEQAPLSVAITNLKGEIDYVNPCFTEVSGYTLEEVLGQNPRVLKSGATPESVYREMWDTLTAGGVWRGELINRKKNGENYIESAIIAPVVGPDGATTHYVALKEDITERKKTEAALRETQERFRMIAQNISDVVWLYDLAADCFLYVSPSALRVHGRPGEAYLHRRFEDAWLPPQAVAMNRAELPRRVEACRRDPEAPRVLQLETEQIHADGHLVPTEIVMTIVDGPDGQPTRLLGVTRDISERKRAAAALEQSERLYRMIADNTSDVTWVSELKSGAFTYVSPACEHILGYTPVELVGRPVVSILSESSRRQVLESLPQRVRAFDEGDESARTRMQLFETLHADGRIVFGETVTTLLAGRDGKAERLIGVSRDVTQRKLAEEALLGSRDRLANAERMAHLGNWESRLTDRQQEWSDELFRIYEFEVTPHRVVSHEQFRTRVHPDDLARVEDAFVEAIALRRPVHLEHRLLFPDGRIKHVEVSGWIRQDEGGNSVGVLGTVQDVTGRKEAEIALHELVKQLRAYHAVSVVLADRTRPVGDLLEVVATQLPGALRDPDYVQVEVVFGGSKVHSGRPGRPVVEIREELRVGQKRGHVAVGYVGRSSVVEREAQLHPEEREIVGGIARALGIALGERESFAQLAASEGRFRAIFDLAGVGMFESSVDGRITRANRFLGELLGAEPADLAGRWWSDFCPSLADRQMPPPSQPLEVVCRRADGREFWGAISSNVELDERAGALGRIGLWREITTEVEARETLLRFNADLEEKVAKRTAELANRNREIQALVQAIPDLVIQLKDDGTVLNLEPARGASRLSRIHQPEELALLAAVLAEARALGPRALATQAIVASEKEIEPGLVLDLRAAPSAPASSVVLVRDITARKQLETETVRMLEQAKELAAMKTRFISVTSHEFRTPMAAALGSVDLLQNHSDRLTAAKRTELFERVRVSLKRMTEMLDDVLTLNRLDAKRSEIKLVTVNLAHEIRGMLEEIRAGDRGAHEFVQVVTHEVPDFRTDTGMLHHILSNLLSNAARYSPAGTTITVRQCRRASGIEIVVEDRGIGIPPEDQARIWEPFERASNAGEIKGTGLGLNIVKRMTEQLHGTVSLECPPTGGSRFILRFPESPAPESA